MTPIEKIKYDILLQAVANSDISEVDIDPLHIEESYERLLTEQSMHCDYESEFRGSGIYTGLQCEYSRHYESKAVACQTNDGSWVGWTYWYGGGKHAEPESIDWMANAYDLVVTEEEKMVVVRTFCKTVDNELAISGTY